jgi:ribosome maturation factor RimP
MKAFTVLMAVLLVVCPAFQEIAFAEQSSQRVVSTEELQNLVAGKPVKGDTGAATAGTISEQESKRGKEIKSMVEMLGVGAEVRFRLRNTPDRSGIIEEVGDETFKLLRKGDTQTLDYDQVTYMSLKSTKYKAKGQIEPSKVRQIVVFLGPGKKIDMKLDSDTKLKGKIQSIEAENFTIVDSKGDQSNAISFSQVKEIKEAKLPGWALAAIIGGIAFGILLGAVAIGAATGSFG